MADPLMAIEETTGWQVGASKSDLVKGNNTKVGRQSLYLCVPGTKSIAGWGGAVHQYDHRTRTAVNVEGVDAAYIDVLTHLAHPLNTKDFMTTVTVWVCACS